MQLSRFDALVGPAYKYQSLPVDCQECVNLECVKVGSSASPFKNMLVSTAGTKAIKFRYNGVVYDTLPTELSMKSRIRGIHKCAMPFSNDVDDGFIVVGTDIVFKMSKPDNNLVADIVKIGVISEGSNKVSIVDSGYVSGGTQNQKISIADGSTLYSVDMGTLALESLGNIAPLRPHALTYVDGRVFMCGNQVNDNGRSQRFYFSGLNNPTEWDYLDYKSATANSDPIQSICVVGNYLWVIGTETYEIWQTVSSSSSSTITDPIKRVSGIASGVGTSSEQSVASIAASVFFVGGGETGRLRIYEGSSNGSIKVISTDAMAQELATYKSLENSVGFCWADNGNVYYGVTFQSDDVTWVYNVTSQNWHKRTSTKKSITHRWCIDSTESAYNMVIGGSLDNGKLYHLSDKYYDDDGEPIVRKRVAPHLTANGKDLVHDSLTIEMECGNAQPYGQGSDPKVMLKILDDGGRTERATRWKSAGKLGDYRARVKFYDLGSTRDRVYEIGLSDPVRWTILGAYIETTEAIGG